MRKRAYGEPAHGCARGVARLTQIELSRKSGVPQETISQIERGRANPTMSTLEKLARAMGAKINLTIG
ncbi:helix-turn-helix domain-containing protein [Paratractidigestivibacter faecalis]|uniref:helix-turn-helix domain-containing protein n=1 Tax=Paratractidigestivibacter faecalis TaxID=2292441 RepID=UPI003A95397A